MEHDLTDPFLILLDLEKKARVNAHTLPQSQHIKREDTFIRFQCGDYGLAADIGHVAEITRVPMMTRIPGVHAWVKGLANIRGHLIAVIDLGEYLFKKATQIDARNRILVVDHPSQCAILVDQIEGLQNLQTKDLNLTSMQKSSSENGAEKFLIAKIEEQSNNWIVNLRDLVTDLHLYDAY